MHYNKIMEQKGMSEFKELIKKWEVLSCNIKERPIDAPIILPDIFLVSPSGAGRTFLLELLADYLVSRGNLMDFYGDVKYFEFMLNYCPPDQPFSELSRLMNEVDNAAGFRNEYKGIVFIEIDEWVEHCKEKHFLSLLEYLSDNSHTWLLVLSLSDRFGKDADKVEAVVSAFLRTEKVTIEAPATCELIEYAKEILDGYGFALKADAAKLLCETVDKLRENEYFDGYKTVKKLCADIAYTVYSKPKRAPRWLGADTIAEFAPDGEYVRKMMIKIEQRKAIGFC